MLLNLLSWARVWKGFQSSVQVDVWMQDTDGAFQLENEIWAARPLGSKQNHLSGVQFYWTLKSNVVQPLTSSDDTHASPEPSRCYQEDVRSALPVAYRLVLCERCPVLFLLLEMLPTRGCCWSFRSLKLACLSSTSLSWLRAVLFSGAQLTIRFLQQLLRKGALDNNSANQRACFLLARVLMWKSASLNKIIIFFSSPDWCLHLWASVF